MRTLSAYFQKRKIGLIGYPINHSLSPRLFYETFRDNRKVLDKYSYDLIGCRSFEEAMKIFKEEYYAVNVTSPFKELAFGAADIISYNAERSGAANLLVKRVNGSIAAYNTDFTAVSLIIGKFLSGNELGRSGGSILVTGCGGAGKAAVAASLESGRKVVVCNRDLNKTLRYKEYLEQCGLNGRVDSLECVGLDSLQDVVSQAEIVIHTLPVPVILPQMNIFSGKKILEANYRSPSFASEFISEMGILYVGGEEWLRLQAEQTYRIVID